MQGKANTHSAVELTAQSLRVLALSGAEGDFLGSEDDLLLQLGVSRPTFRQACAQVLQESLIVVRRGVGGGYFARRPESLTVSRIAAIYLQAQNAGLDEIIHAMKPIRMEIAMLAARNRDPGLLDKLRGFLEEEEQAGSAGQNDYRSFLRSERAFGKVLGLLSGNSVLNLFLAILYDFAGRLRREEDVLVNRPERIAAYRKLRMAMGRAISDGDEEIAVISTGRCSDLISDWMREDLGGRQFGDDDLGGRNI